MPRDVIATPTAPFDGDVEIRRATKADIPGIRAALANTWRDTYGAFVPLEAIEWTTAAWHAPAVLAAELVNPSTFVDDCREAPSDAQTMFHDLGPTSARINDPRHIAPHP